MSDKIKFSVLCFSALGLFIASAVAWAFFGSRAAAGIIAGGAWNLTSLWCLTRLLQAWIGPKPSQRRAMAWALVKFPLLYAAIFVVFQTKIVAFAAFSAGFSIVLATALAAFVFSLRQATGQQTKP